AGRVSRISSGWPPTWLASHRSHPRGRPQPSGQAIQADRSAPSTCSAHDEVVHVVYFYNTCNLPVNRPKMSVVALLFGVTSPRGLLRRGLLRRFTKVFCGRSRGLQIRLG